MGHKRETWTLDYRPGGGMLASGGDDHMVRLWEPDSGLVLGTLAGHSTTVSAVAFSPRGRMLASADLAGRVVIWDVETRSMRSSFSSGADQVRCLAFHPIRPVLAIGRSDGVIVLWDVEQGQKLREWPAHGRTKVRALAFDPRQGRRLASGGNDKTARLWDVGSGDILAVQPIRSLVADLAYSPVDEEVAIADEDGDISLWDLGTNQIERRMSADSEMLNTIAYVPDGTALATAGKSRRIVIWDPVIGQQLLEIDGTQFHKTELMTLVFSTDGMELATGSHDGAIHLWRAGQPHR